MLCERISRVAFDVLSSGPVFFCVSLISPFLRVTLASEEGSKLTGRRAAASRRHIPQAAMIHTDSKGDREGEAGWRRGAERERERVMATLTKAFNRLRGQNMYTLSLSVHSVIATEQRMRLCVCVCVGWTQSVWWAAFSFLLGRVVGIESEELF